MWDFLKRFIFVLGVVFVKVATPFHMGFDFFFGIFMTPIKLGCVYLEVIDVFVRNRCETWECLQEA